MKTARAARERRWRQRERRGSDGANSEGVATVVGGGGGRDEVEDSGGVEEGIEVGVWLLRKSHRDEREMGDGRMEWDSILQMEEMRTVLQRVTRSKVFQFQINFLKS